MWLTAWLLTGALAPPALQDAITIEPVAVPLATEQEVILPPLPAKPGHAIVLTFRAYSQAATEAGCNYNGAFRLNGTTLGRYTAAGTERLLNRPPMFELVTDPHHRQFPVFNGPSTMLLFAPDADRGDAMTTDGQGVTFVLDVSDAAQGVDGNLLQIRNLLTQPNTASGDLRFEDARLGWFPVERLPQPASRVPDRGGIADGIETDEVRLEQATAGGFLVRGNGETLRIETGLGLAPETAAALRAEDGEAEPTVVGEPFGQGRRMVVDWPDLRLTRTLVLREGGVDWTETWHNRAASIRGVPFTHRIFLDDGPGKFYVAGSPEVTAQASSAPNPTMVVERPATVAGFGISAEDDLLRLLLGLRARAGVGEIYSDQLALPPDGRITFRLRVEPIAAGGYWTYINRLRDRWGVNGTTMARPLFWGWARKPDIVDPTERMRQSLAHLGPIYLTFGDWQRLEPDAKTVTADRFPKLAGEDEPDIAAFLTYEHRERFWTQLELDLARLAEGAPNVAPVALLHPAMETIYKPARDRWPIANEVIQNAEGEPFEHGGYSRAWLGDRTARGWGVLYFVPKPGSVYLDQILAGLTRALDEVGLAGIYCDEFSWAGNRRDYSRYDYSTWDGFSADLAADGSVLRLKSDNAAVTEIAQLRMTGETLRRGKFFLGNGGNALRALNEQPVQRFIEGGNGYWMMANGHLSPVPLVLGNMGDQTSAKGVFEAVKTCLSLGCIYSPPAVNLLLSGPDNFVSKLYPLTVREIGPGYVRGDERLITTVAWPNEWPATPAARWVYRYDESGGLLESRELEPDQPLPAVPANGLLIVETR